MLNELNNYSSLTAIDPVEVHLEGGRVVQAKKRRTVHIDISAGQSGCERLTRLSRSNVLFIAEASINVI